MDGVTLFVFHSCAYIYICGCVGAIKLHTPQAYELGEGGNGWCGTKRTRFAHPIHHCQIVKLCNTTHYLPSRFHSRVTHTTKYACCFTPWRMRYPHFLCLFNTYCRISFTRFFQFHLRSVHRCDFLIESIGWFVIAIRIGIHRFRGDHTRVANWPVCCCRNW